jgi:uncharacterized Zn finger protein
MRRRRRHDFWNFPTSTPRAAKGGIKAQSRRGAFAEHWWAKRWLEVLESFDLGERMNRGRRYARRGQVLSIEVGPGIVAAMVQGSRPEPYLVTITLRPIPDRGWEKLTAALQQQALFAAKLLAGEMPEGLEEVFREAGLSLFPEQSRDLQTECSCPDWSNPCKHIAAVHYLLAEEFDRDPFLIFALRGLDRDELVARLSLGIAEEPQLERPEPPVPAEPLPTNPAVFWGERPLPEGLLPEARIPPVVAALVKRLGSFPLWRGEERFLETMEALYPRAAARGLEVFLAEQELSPPQAITGRPRGVRMRHD